jgi:hypothetical protein
MEPGNLSAALELTLRPVEAGWIAELEFRSGADSSSLAVDELAVSDEQTVRFKTTLEGARLAFDLNIGGDGLLLGHVEVTEGERVLAAGPVGFAPAGDEVAAQRLAQWLGRQGQPVDAVHRQAVIDRAAELFQANYVFEEQARQAAAALRERAAAGEFDSIATAAQLAEALGANLAEATGDKHVRVKFSSETYLDPLADLDDEPSREEYEELRQAAAAEGCGIGEPQLLAGEVGYLPLTRFFPADIGGGPLAAAMQKLAPARALVIDLRECRGGDPEMVALVASWLLPPPSRHWCDMQRRLDDSSRQYWTAAWLPGPRFVDKPVYVLTAQRTFSAPESLAYELQQTRRATVVGEATGGGAHPGAWFPLTDGFALFIPLSRYISPVSGTDWEGRGVQPDVPCPAAEALDTAAELARQAT